MNINLTTKERMLLEDQKSHEEICVQKYTSYANQASCPQLKQMFSNFANNEQQHLNTINQLLSGQVPATNQQSGGAAKQQANVQPQASFINNQSDQALCTDMLMTEKYVSGVYDTAIFEFKDPQVRDVLSHIQKEEQKHGEAIFQYMQSKGMYNLS